MKVIGLTGGIASGKSLVSKMIQEYGFTVIDTDEIAKDILNNNQEVINKVKQFFPESYQGNNKINRKILGEIIFYDQNRRMLLNDIIHPLVKQIVLKTIKESNDEYLFIDVPLLYEANFSNICDEVIVVYVTYDTQLKRLMVRDNIDEEYAHQKICSQMNLEEKKMLADYVIDNNGSIENTKQQLIDILKQITKGRN